MPLLAQTVLTPKTRGLLNVNTVLINGSAGAQTDPHVSQNMAAYSGVMSGQIRYYNFTTSADLGISNVTASGELASDFLADVYNTSVVFTRESSAGSDIELFDTVSGTLTTIDPTTAPNREQPAIGGPCQSMPGRIEHHAVGQLRPLAGNGEHLGDVRQMSAPGVAHQEPPLSPANHQPQQNTV